MREAGPWRFQRFMTSPQITPVYFSDYFGVSADALERYGAFNISLVTDLPLFIDPFLLFNSRKRRYQLLHDEIIRYLRFLRDRAGRSDLGDGLRSAWYRFPEVKQTWLGFTARGNSGHGLGGDFARSLHDNLARLFSDFGEERVTKGSHLEKLCLIKEGVGRDNISDFTTNLLRAYLAGYTQTFAQRHIRPELRRVVPVAKARFNYQTETWQTERYDLPWRKGDFVLLTPRDILTKDDTWINKSDLVDDFERIPDAIPDAELRAQINNYFRKLLPKKPTRKDERAAAMATLLQFRELIDYYIRYKEEHGEEAESISSERVAFSRDLYVRQFGLLRQLLAQQTAFYDIAGDSYEEAHQRIAFLKDVVENKGGHRIFYVRGQPVEREEDAQILYRLTWYGTAFDVSREVNDGRGPADFKISHGSRDKTVVEFKLAGNPKLKQNLAKQAEVYQKASDAPHAIKVIFYFSDEQFGRVQKILRDLKIVGSRDVVLIDARSDNKPSGSMAA